MGLEATAVVVPLKMVEVWNFIDIELVLIVTEQGPKAGMVARTIAGIIVGLASADWKAKATELARRALTMAIIEQQRMAAELVSLGQQGSDFKVVELAG